MSFLTSLPTSLQLWYLMSYVNVLPHSTLTEHPPDSFESTPNSRSDSRPIPNSLTCSPHSSLDDVQPDSASALFRQRKMSPLMHTVREGEMIRREERRKCKYTIKSMATHRGHPHPRSAHHLRPHHPLPRRLYPPTPPAHLPPPCPCPSSTHREALASCSTAERLRWQLC